MRIKKGFIPISQGIQHVFIIVVGFVVLALLITWGVTAIAATKSAERASLVYSLTTAINSLSNVDKGLMEKELKGIYNIEIDCNGECYIKTTSYEDGKKGESSEKVLIIGDIQHISKKINRINKVCIEKVPTSKVVIRGC